METKQNLLAQGYKEYHTYADFKKDNLTYESCWVDLAKNKDYSVYVGVNSRNETADQMCSSCFKVTSRSFINKYSNEIQCSVCLTQQEIPI